MELDVDSSWVMWKATVFEVVWVLTEVLTASKVVKPVQPSEMVLVCWGYFEVEGFHSEFVVALVVMVKFVSVAVMCFVARCGKSD